MDHLKEFNGIRVKGDQDVFGTSVKDGTEILVKTVAEFDGYQCQIWAPEFHSIMLDSAISFAKESEILRKCLKFEENPDKRCKEISDTEGNVENSFKVMQLSFTSITLCISAVESWVNKTIQCELNDQLTYSRLDGKSVNWEANRIEKEASLGEKVFCVVPAMYGIGQIGPHVTFRKRFIEIIDDRNAFMHMKHEPRVSGERTKRMNLSLKLLRRNALLVPENAISLIKMIHDKAGKPLPLWVIGNIGSVEAAKHEVNRI